jgi:hypothetical protein
MRKIPKPYRNILALLKKLYGGGNSPVVAVKDENGKEMAMYL